MTQFTILRFSAKHGYAVLDNFLREIPDWENLNYTELHDAYRSRRYIYINAFADCMEALGNKAVDIVYDVECLQKKWADEHDFTYSEENWQQEIILEQIRHYRPDVVYAMEIFFLPVAILKDFKTRFPFIRLFVSQKGFPHAFKELATADLVYTCTPGIVDQFQKKGVNARLLYHCFDETILDAFAGNEKIVQQWPCGFIGSSGYGYPNHSFRYALLAELFEKTELRGWLHEIEPNRPINQRPLSKLYPDQVENPCFGLEMYKRLLSCGVVLNIHTDAADKYVGNMRLFEATGVGVCLLTDTGVNMPELFEEGVDVVTFSSREECFIKLEELLGNAALRKSVATRGQKKTLTCHTLTARCKQIHEELSALL